MVIKKNKKDFYVSENTQVIVKINEFSASSIDILVRCFTTSNDYNRLVEIKDKLAINIKDIVEKRDALLPSLLNLYILKKTRHLV